MRELPEPTITPVLLDEFKQALAGGRGDLDAWLEVNDEAEVRAFVLAIQKQAYGDGLRDAAENTEKLRAALVNLCDAADSTNYPSHGPCWDRLWNTSVEARKALSAMLTASKKEPQ